MKQAWRTLGLGLTAALIHIVYLALNVSILSDAIKLAFAQARKPGLFWLTGSRRFIV